MSGSSSGALPRLAREALADALRRRIVPVIVALAVLSLLFVDTCTSCSPTVVRDGEPVSLPEIAGFGGLLVAVLLGLWSMVLAGVLASDHLAEPLSDGSAELVLARPVPRGVFVLSRWLGTCALAGATALVLLAATAALLHARQGLPLAPMLPAAGACLAGLATVAALAMAASLWLPRTLTALLAFAAVWSVAAANLAGQLAAELTGLPGWIDRLGPPLASGIARPLSGWIEPAAVVRGDPLELGLRAGVWLLGAVALLVLAFRRVELPR